jgi:hypothetical protein
MYLEARRGLGRLLQGFSVLAGLSRLPAQSRRRWMIGSSSHLTVADLLVGQGAHGADLFHFNSIAVSLFSQKRKMKT